MRTAAVGVLLLAGRIAAADPFAVNGWQFHERNVPKVAEAIAKAPEYGVNLFIFSHELFDHVEEFLASPERQREILHLGALADRQGIPWYLWVHEFDDVPERFLVKTEVAADDPRAAAAAESSSFRLGGRVDMDDPALHDYLRDRYERLLARCPNTAGLVLTFHESDRKLFRNSEVRSKLPVPDRIHGVTTLVHDVLRKHGKKLILRNFFYEPREMEYFAAVVGRLPDDIVLMSKDTVHEFHPFYPPDPQHGKAGRKAQLMELDLGVEKAWSRHGHYAQPAYIQRYVQRARDLGLAGAVGRARLMWDRPFEDSHEVNLYAFSRFMADPGAGVDAVLQDWARRRYPAEAAPFVASALERTEHIQHHGRWFLGLWLTKSIGEEWGDYPYYFGHILLRSRHKWTRDPADEALEKGLYSPDDALFSRLLAEKDEVIDQVRAGLEDLRSAARYLRPEQAEDLREGFRYLLDAAELQKQWTRAFFAMRMWMEEPRADREMVVADALARLEAMDRLPGIPYGRDPRTGHRYNIDRFALEVRWRMANRARAREEDRRILELTRRLVSVEQN